MVTDNGFQNRENVKMTFVSIVYKAQLSLKWGKSGVGFTMINQSRTNGPINAHLTIAQV